MRNYYYMLINSEAFKTPTTDLQVCRGPRKIIFMIFLLLSVSNSSREQTLYELKHRKKTLFVNISTTVQILIDYKYHQVNFYFFLERKLGKY